MAVYLGSNRVSVRGGQPVLYTNTNDVKKTGTFSASSAQTSEMTIDTGLDEVSAFFIYYSEGSQYGYSFAWGYSDIVNYCIYYYPNLGIMYDISDSDKIYVTTSGGSVTCKRYNNNGTCDIKSGTYNWIAYGKSVNNTYAPISIKKMTVTIETDSDSLIVNSGFNSVDSVIVNKNTSNYMWTYNELFDMVGSRETHIDLNSSKVSIDGGVITCNEYSTGIHVEAGTYEVIVFGSGDSGGSSPNLQSKSVSPSESSQTVTPDSGYDGLSQVTVSAISNTYVGSGITKKAAATYTPSTSNQTIASGQYLNGAQTIKGDSNLVASNIKSGVSIFGVSGSYTASSSGTDTSDATATASDILSGKTAYVKGSKITGTIASQAAQTITPGTSDKTIASGKYLSGTQTIKGDANLVASNIKSGVSIFGVAGSYTGSGGSGSSTNNCEAYHITSTSATINFQGSGTVKVFGYGAKKSTYMTTIYSFVGDGYYAGTSYGTPSKTSASFSVSGGKLSGLPSGLTAVDLLVVIGV